LRISFLTRRIAVVSAVIALAGGTAAGALAASGSSSAASSPAAAAAASGQIVGCVKTSGGAPRTMQNVYTGVANFRGCPAGTFQAGPWNVRGPRGATGAKGATGAAGPQGPAGPAGQDAQALPYGIGQVLVDRGTGATAWATYSTTLGSPAGDTESGTFRFTCKNVTDGCNLSVQARATASGYQVYPRVLIIKADNSGTGEIRSTCEYADGSDNDGASTAVGTSATPVPLGVGGTFDCGGSQSGTPASGVTDINVPGSAGQGLHYDVFTTLVFAKAG